MSEKEQSRIRHKDDAAMRKLKQAQRQTNSDGLPCGPDRQLVSDKSEIAKQHENASQWIARRLWSWTVIAIVFSLLSGGAISMVTSAAPNVLGIARWMFISGNVLLAVKLITFKDLRERSRIWVMLLCLIVLARFTLIETAWVYRTDREIGGTEVYNKLAGTVEVPRSGNVMHSVFTVTNNSTKTIDWHQISCNANLIIWDHGRSDLKGTNWRVDSFTGPLLPGGDAESDRCLSTFALTLADNNNTAIPDCIDAVLSIAYSIDGYSDSRHEKRFRFVFIGDEMSWHAQPSESNRSYCSPYHKPTDRP
jgi:hypothetical protein